jgi:hypothetical protein
MEQSMDGEIIKIQSQYPLTLFQKYCFCKLWVLLQWTTLKGNLCKDQIVILSEVLPNCHGYIDIRILWQVELLNVMVKKLYSCILFLHRFAILKKYLQSKKEACIQFKWCIQVDVLGYHIIICCVENDTINRWNMKKNL